MKPPRSSARRLAASLHEAYADRDDGPDVVLERARRVFVGLRAELEPVFGKLAFDLLANRALAAARHETPALAALSIDTGGTIQGTIGSGGDPDGVRAAIESTVEFFVELCIELIGEELTTRFVRDAIRASGSKPPPRVPGE